MRGVLLTSKTKIVFSEDWHIKKNPIKTGGFFKIIMVRYCNRIIPTERSQCFWEMSLNEPAFSCFFNKGEVITVFNVEDDFQLSFSVFNGGT